MSLSDLFSNLRKEQNFTVSLQVNYPQSSHSSPSSSKEQREKRSRNVDDGYPHSSERNTPRPENHYKETKRTEKYYRDADKEVGRISKSVKRDKYASTDRALDNQSSTQCTAYHHSSTSRDYSTIDARGRYHDRSEEKARISPSSKRDKSSLLSSTSRRSIETKRYSSIDQRPVEKAARQSPSTRTAIDKSRFSIDERIYPDGARKSSNRPLEIKADKKSINPNKPISKQSAPQQSKQHRRPPSIEKSQKRSPNDKIQASPPFKKKVVQKKTNSVSDDDIFTTSAPLMKSSTALNLKQVYPSFFTIRF
jgi:hypothetical protein